jgi:hypothetical protein
MQCVEILVGHSSDFHGQHRIRQCEISVFCCWRVALPHQTQRHATGPRLTVAARDRGSGRHCDSVAMGRRDSLSGEAPNPGGRRRGAGRRPHPALAVTLTRRIECPASFRHPRNCAVRSVRSRRRHPAAVPGRGVLAPCTAPQLFHKPDALAPRGSPCGFAVAPERPARRWQVARGRSSARCHR